jgi:hypothetical protein
LATVCFDQQIFVPRKENPRNDSSRRKTAMSESSDMSATTTPATISKPKKHKPALKLGMWPIIASEEDAKWATRQGAWAAVFCASATAAMAVWSHYSNEVAMVSGLSLFALLDAALFAAVAVGVFLRSRVAAVGGLLLYAAERLAAPMDANLKALAMLVVLVACYISGIRGAFAYHRYRAQAKLDPTAPIGP